MALPVTINAVSNRRQNVDITSSGNTYVSGYTKSRTDFVIIIIIINNIERKISSL